MDAFSGLEGALKALFIFFVLLLPLVMVGVGLLIGWFIWG